MPKDTNHKIFGYDWADIQNAQRGGSLHKPITLKSLQAATDDDRRLLAEFGSIEELKNAGLHGVADRLSRD